MAKKNTTGNTPEQEAIVEAVTKRCRGVHLVEPEKQTTRFEAWYALERKDNVKGAAKMIAELAEAANEHTPAGYIVSAPIVPEDADWDALRRLAFPLIRLRGDAVGRTCGWDLNEEIVQHPFDGAEHLTECPNCGIEISWKAPVFHDE